MDFEVRTDDLRRHRVLDVAPPRPGEGEVLLGVDHAALTANNITYGAVGGAMRYWEFFPTEPGWGRIPVWGFADVVESRVDGIREGDRFYGYFPMSSHLVVRPTRVTTAAFVDGSPHRAELAAAYNQYVRVGDAASRAVEHRIAILRPLFTTSFLIDDWFADEGFFGATSMVIASASSKTALALAALVHARPGIEVVGLTSERNAAFVRDVGYYDRVAVYGSVADLDVTQPTVFVDMAGDAAVVADVHRHVGDALRHSCGVGATHWENLGPAGDLPGPRPEFFFAPSQVRKRIRDWGADGFDERVDAAFARFDASAESWLTVVEHRGATAITAAYLDVLEGRVAPDQGYVIDLGGIS